MRALKNKVLYLHENIKIRVTELTGKKRVSQDEVNAIKETFQRYQKLLRELKEFGRGQQIIAVEVTILEPLSISTPHISKKNRYLIYYEGVTEQEAKELIWAQFPHAVIKSTKILTTGQKIAI